MNSGNGRHTDHGRRNRGNSTFGKDCVVACCAQINGGGPQSGDTAQSRLRTKQISKSRNFGRTVEGPYQKTDGKGARNHEYELGVEVGGEYEGEESRFVDGFIYRRSTKSRRPRPKNIVMRGPCWCLVKWKLPV
jgi:hypothetical protein